MLALQVGAVHITGCAVDPGGAVRERARWFTRPERGPDAVLDSVLGCAATLADRWRPTAAGIVLPGAVDEVSGRAVRATALGWHGTPVGDWAAEHLDLPVAVGHDGRTAALAEARDGAGRDCPDFLSVSVGDGVAAALVVGGRIVRAGPPEADELGHTVVRPGGEPCHCGGRGCLEAVASGAAVSRRYARATSWRGLSAREVYHRADAGDAAALAIRAEALDALADAVAPVVGRHRPERLVLGVGPAEAGASCVPPLRAALAARLTGQDVPDLRPARFGDGSACVGAALLARDLGRVRAAGQGAGPLGGGS
ncbi:ROK family protein [Streptomyces sp. NPDC046887]|uniref:ROK family protein n=1 Tax=Streptomyces sp. NPDC046887 TaxID=3155472 RepID=UPI0033F52B3E